MVRGMKHYIYTCEADGSEAPLVMADGRIIEFESESRADAFLNALKNSTIFAEETEEFQGFTNIAYVKSAIVYCDDGYIDADAAEMEIFGCILSENLKMAEKIEELLENFYFNDTNEEYSPYGNEDSYYEGVRMDEAIDTLFRENGFEDEEYNCELIETFDSPGITCFALAVSWIENGKLKVYNDTACIL